MSEEEHRRRRSSSSRDRRHRKEHKHKERSRSRSKNKKHQKKGRDERRQEKHHKHKEKRNVGSKDRSSSHVRRRETPHFPWRNAEYIEKYKVHARITKIEGLIADGTFGRCLKVSYGKSEYAAKVIKPVKKYIEAAVEEISMLQKMNHADNYEYSPTYIESFYFEEHFVIVTSLHGDSLFSVLKYYNKDGFPLPILRIIAKEIITGLNIMHTKAHMTHTDLKPENIVFSQSTQLGKFKYKDTRFYVPKQLKIKIIDYGNAVMNSESGSSIINTRQFRAPEVILKHVRWDHRSDTWSIGCILMELFMGKLLFNTSSTYEHLLMMEKILGSSWELTQATFPQSMIAQIKNKEVTALFDLNRQKANGSYLRSPDEIDEKLNPAHINKLQTIDELVDLYPYLKVERRQFKELIKQLLAIDPNKRISLADALKHPFFDDFYEEDHAYVFEKIAKYFQRRENIFK